jgi:hypothetical protein
LGRWRYVGDQSALAIQETFEQVDAAAAGGDPRGVGDHRDLGNQVRGGARPVIDGALQRRDPDRPERVDPGTGLEQHPDQLDAVKAGGEVERLIQVAAAGDEKLDARPVDPELMPERRPEDVRLRHRAQKRPTRAHLEADQIGIGVEQPGERIEVSGADRVQRGAEGVMGLVCA